MTDDRRLRVLEAFFALMHSRADPASSNYAGSQVGHAFCSAAQQSGLLRGRADSANSFHPAAHPLTDEGRLSLIRGMASDEVAEHLRR